MSLADELTLGQTKQSPDAPKRTRQRKESLTRNIDNLAQTVVEEYERDIRDRTEWNRARVQREAKRRGWLEEKSDPWPGASNAHDPMMMANSLRLKDSLFNAVMTTSPTISAEALHGGDVGKQDRVERLLHHQFFTDQPGEDRVSDLADTFVDDGTMLAYSTWVRDDQVIADTHILDPIPSGVHPKDYLRPFIFSMFKDATDVNISDDGFTWKLTLPDTKTGKDRQVKVEAYTEGDGQPVRLVETGKKRVFDGPIAVAKSIEDWGGPFRSENVQPPGPSNPSGAQHVWLADYPTLDEIRRLKDMGYYDLLTDDQMDELAGQPKSLPGQGDENDTIKQFKDDAEGTALTAPTESTAKRLTRLISFRGLDIDDDGLEEQVVAVVIKETKTLLRVTLLNEQFPSDRPHRPLMLRKFIPVKDRLYGISLTEVLEPLYDMKKVLLDQLVDGGTLRVMPFGLCKTQGGLRNEPMRIRPGVLWPTPNPREDVNVLQFGNTADALFTNLITLYSQWDDELTMIGALQFGQVPGGKASALRTVGGMQAVLQQADARPEHILRRFLSGLAEIYATWHDLNQALLPKGKEIRMVGIAKPGEDVYQTITDKNQIAGRYQFTFKATVLNMSKGLMAQSTSSLLQVTAQPMMLEMGIATPDGLYRLMREFYKANGRDPDGGYISAPSPEAHLPKISAQDALTLILMHKEPAGVPSEAGGIPEHLETLQTLPDTLLLTEFQQFLYQRWVTQLQQKAAQQAQQQKMMQAAQQFQQNMGQMGGQGGGRPPQAPAEMPMPGPAGNAMVSPNELLSESLPSSGGGANPGGIQ